MSGWVKCEVVELTAKQFKAMAALDPVGNRVIVEQWFSPRKGTKTYFRFGEGKGKREWLVTRSGKLTENSTPGSGTPR